MFRPYSDDSAKVASELRSTIIANYSGSTHRNGSIYNLVTSYLSSYNFSDYLSAGLIKSN